MLDPLTQGFLTAVGQKLGQFATDKSKEYLEQRQPEFQRLSPSDRDNIALILKEKLANGEYTVVQGIFNTVDSELQKRQRLIQSDKHNIASAFKQAMDSGNYRIVEGVFNRSE